MKTFLGKPNQAHYTPTYMYKKVEFNCIKQLKFTPSSVMLNDAYLSHKLFNKMETQLRDNTIQCNCTLHN